MKQYDREGVNAVEQIFLKEFGWLFREQPISDYGVDAHVEVTEGSKPLGRLLALQIKSGPSFFKMTKEGNYRYYGEYRHLDYWQRHSLPVIIVLHNPETGMTLWQRVEDDNIRNGTKGWSIDIPPENALDAKSKEKLEKGVSDISVRRRLRLMFDLPLIKEVHKRLSQLEDIYLVVEEWPNKGLGMRDATLFFGEIDGSDKITVSNWLPTHSLDEYMAHAWPWLDYEYVEESPNVDGADECVGHELSVELNDIGEAFIVLERFYEGGVEIRPEVPEPETVEEEEFFGFDDKEPYDEK